jgi:betaine-homocysteine S-methyltransferase
MRQKRNKQNILEKLKKGTVIGAEGYVFELEKRGYIKAGPYVPEVVLDFPDAVKELHREFLLAGSDIIIALTYYANKNKLADVGREKDFEKLNRQAVRLANEVAKEGDALVAGNICNTWMYDPKNKVESSKIVRKIYEEQIKWAVEEGVDFIISETNDYLGEALIGLEVIKSFGLPAMVNFASVQKDKTRDGYDYIEACKILVASGADIVGFNCDRGPATMLPLLKKLRKEVDGFISALPVPYKTTTKQPTFESLKEKGQRKYPINLEPFLCNRFEMAEFAKEAKKIGVNYIGICCGGMPYQIRSMAEALGRTTPASKYSPAMELHPMIGTKANAKDKKEFANDWKD